MKPKTVGILFLLSAVFSTVDVIYYGLYVSEKGYEFYNIIPIKEIYEYLTTTLGGLLSFMSIAPLLVAWYAISKKEKKEKTKRRKKV